MKDFRELNAIFFQELIKYYKQNNLKYKEDYRLVRKLKDPIKEIEKRLGTTREKQLPESDKLHGYMLEHGG